MITQALKKLPFRRTFSALQHPNYRLWFAGQIVSLFGTWMQSTAQGFLIYELTHSPAFLGYVGFASGLPSWLFMLWGGVVADRIPRRKLLIITQTCMMVLALILALLAYTNLVQPWHIILLAFLLGVANAFDAPARLALAPELVPLRDLTNAIALNGTMFNTAVVLGPTIGALVYAAVGPAWCFLLNGLSFVAVIGALWRMNLPHAEKQIKPSTSPIQEIIEGLRYTAAEPTIRIIIANISALSLLGGSFITLMPAWAVEVLGGDVTTNGLLNSARGLGALVGALAIASLGRFNYRGRLLTIGAFVFPAALLLFSFARDLPVSLSILMLVGAANLLIMNMSNSLIQTTSPDHMRGRVNSIYSMTFFGFMPLGSLLIGQMAEITSEALAIELGSILLLGEAILIWFIYPRLRTLE